MLRDLLIGGGLGVAFYWWRNQVQQGVLTAGKSQAEIQQLRQDLALAQQALMTAQTQRNTLETQVAELNQLATDRAIELIQLQADHADLTAKVAELTQKRTRKKRTPKVEITAEPHIDQAVFSDLAPETFTLDLEVIQAKQMESAKAAQLLESVFIEESIAAPSTEALLGLDSAHAVFLQTLQQQTLWSREDLLRVTQPLNLLLDGALELINEAAFERCDEALTVGDDPLEVNPEVLQELLS